MEFFDETKFSLMGKQHRKNYSLKGEIFVDEDKREAILEAAIEVIAESGYYNTKMSWIADRAGIAVGTIYNYFAGKEEVLEVIFAREFEKRLDILSELEEHDDISSRDKLEKFLQVHFAEIKQNPALGKILVREKEFPKKETGSINNYLNKLPESIQVILETAQADKNGSIDNPPLTAALIFGAIQGVVERAVKSENYRLLDEASDKILLFLDCSRADKEL